MSSPKHPATERHGGPGASHENAKQAPAPRKPNLEEPPGDQGSKRKDAMAARLRAVAPPSSARGRSGSLHSTDTHKKN